LKGQNAGPLSGKLLWFLQGLWKHRFSKGGVFMKQELTPEDVIEMGKMWGDTYLSSLSAEDIVKAVGTEDLVKAVGTEDLVKAVGTEDFVKAVGTEDFVKAMPIVICWPFFLILKTETSLQIPAFMSMRKPGVGHTQGERPRIILWFWMDWTKLNYGKAPGPITLKLFFTARRMSVFNLIKTECLLLTTGCILNPGERMSGSP